MGPGIRIQKLLDTREISQAALARRIGVRQSTVNPLINGNSCTSRSLVKIARELGTTPAYLMGESGDSEADFPDDFFTVEERSRVERINRLAPDDREALGRVLDAMVCGGSPSPSLRRSVQEY